MKTKTKNKSKAYFSSESGLQEYAVIELKKVEKYFEIPIIANPHSSKRNISNKSMSVKHRQNYFRKTKSNNKAQGFQEGQSDLIACYPSYCSNYPGIAIELKEFGKDPFREYCPNNRPTGKLWIAEAKGEDADRARKQADFIGRQLKIGFYGIFCTGKLQFDAIYNWYFKGHDKPEMGRYTFMDKYWNTYTIEYIKSF